MNKDFIKLKNVSKYYYNKGVIASGFSKVNVSFKIGEFVAITGESGSGKSTLLNVISGLDSYEDGEMYIDGLETSHYTEKDFEDYRRKYVGNIFQNFNLINSYTVYQNVELVLLLNGYKKKEIKKQCLDLIKQVGLSKFKNSKVSRLSGGQKQRVAIARALAKDTPIIIADEPTGNLDSKSANGIIKLLSEIANDKLVIIVTHNYEQVEPYVTRKIKMFDGKILEDKIIKEPNEVKEIDKLKYKDITLFNRLRLGIRNTFNIKIKFILLFVVYMFITLALVSEYTSFKKSEYEESISGNNDYFQDTSVKRIIINKNDKSVITEEDFNNISKLNSVKNVVKNDLLIDTGITITNRNEIYVSGSIKNINNIKNVDIGKMPNADNEVVIVGNKSDWMLKKSDDFIDKEFYLESNYGTSEDLKVKVVGIKYDNDQSYNYKIYINDNFANNFGYTINKYYSTIKVKFLDMYHNSDVYESDYNVAASNSVPRNQVYVNELNKYSCPKENCINQNFLINVKNLYYETNLNLTVTNYYNKNNAINLFGYTKDDSKMNVNIFYVNPEDYKTLFNKGIFQSSVYVKSDKDVKGTINKLNNMGYHTLSMKDALVKQEFVKVLQMLKTFVTAFLLIVLFFITYFVIRIILRSRNVYFSTIRMLGANKKTSKELLIIELLNISNLAYFTLLVLIYLSNISIIKYKIIKDMLKFLEFKDYIILYILLIGMSYLVSIKFAKKLFKNSAMSTYREEI